MSTREEQIAAGTVLLTPQELAPRLGFTGLTGWRRVVAKVKAGRIPSVLIGNRPRFHWPTVVQALNRRKAL